MPTFSVEIYQSLLDAMVVRCKATGKPLRHFVSRALSDALGLDHATLFQVSTSAAAEQGWRRRWRRPATPETTPFLHGDLTQDPSQAGRRPGARIREDRPFASFVIPAESGDPGQPANCWACGPGFPLSRE